MRVIALVSTMVVLGWTAGRAELLTVDWKPDEIRDGVASGSIGGAEVRLTSPDGPRNGGRVITQIDWDREAGSNDVEGIADPTVADNFVAIDCGEGTVTLDFGGAKLTNPILLVTFLNARTQEFDFSDDLKMVLLDLEPADSVSIAPGNVVTTNGSHSNTRSDGFALRLTGTFGSVAFETQGVANQPDTIGLSMAVERANIVLPDP